MSRNSQDKTAVTVTAGGEETVKDTPETVVIRFAQPDEDNPFDWKPMKKWYVMDCAHGI